MAMSTDLKVGILRLGHVAGKKKYGLIDERDIQIVQQYIVEPYIDLDKNGCGAIVYASVREPGGDGIADSLFLQDLLWEYHIGLIPEGYEVCHKNGITVDNRLENLELLSYDEMDRMMVEDENYIEPGSLASQQQNSLYWLTVNQLLSDPLEMVDQNYYHPIKWYTLNGEPIDTTGIESCMYYECHFPPCTRMEKEVREFSMCGKCHQVRYCGVSCQERDWTYHKRFCKEHQQWHEQLPDIELVPER